VYRMVVVSYLMMKKTTNLNFSPTLNPEYKI